MLQQNRNITKGGCLLYDVIMPLSSSAATAGLIIFSVVTNDVEATAPWKWMPANQVEKSFD